MVDVQTLADDFAHLFPGVQTGHGVLKNHLHLGAQDLGGVLIQLAADVLAVENDLTGGGLVKPDDTAADGGLAGAGLAHKTVGLAGVDVEAHIVHGPDGVAGIDLKILLKVLDLQKRLLFAHITLPPSSCVQSGPSVPGAFPPWGPGGPAARLPRSGCRTA